MSGDRELSPEGEDGAHYKPWEILAYLSTQPDGAVSKEKLLGALWPDVDPQRAADRRTTALVRLRALLAEQVPGLGAEVVRVERNGICRLDTTRVSSDVRRFLALCRAASKLPPAEARQAHEDARALYRGDLLTEPFYEWVHARDDGGLSLREQYREEYYQATQRLAALYRQDGQAALAVLTVQKPPQGRADARGRGPRPLPVLSAARRPSRARPGAPPPETGDQAGVPYPRRSR